MRYTRELLFILPDQSGDGEHPAYRVREYFSHDMGALQADSGRDQGEYSYILFDLPPTLSDEVKEIIHQCSTVYVPTILGEFEIAGLKRVTDEINRQGVKLGGVFVTMYQARNDAELIEEFRSVLQDRLMQTVIPYSKSVRESQKAELPIEAYFIDRAVPHSKTAWKIVDAYESLAHEVMRGD